VTHQVSKEAIAAAEAYERLHVPALFRQWAPLVCRAARLRPGQRVLDVACGTGVLAREAAGVSGNPELVTGLDPDPGMLDVAGRLAPGIRWREGVAEAIPYQDGSFDAVVSQFGLMFFRDRAAAAREMGRVLAAGGRLAVAVWESLERSQAYPEEVALLDRIAGPEAADALRAPFVLGDPGKLKALFEDAGAMSVEIDTRRGTARFPDVRTMVEADLRGWLPVMGVLLKEAQIERILAEAEHALARYVTPDGSVAFDAPAHIVTAGKPDTGPGASKSPHGPQPMR
jgi:SAM-dependent methyltransferase